MNHVTILHCCFYFLITLVRIFRLMHGKLFQTIMISIYWKLGCFGLHFQHTVSFVIMFVDTPYACSWEQWAVCMSSIINSKLAAVLAAATFWVREDDLSTNLGLEWMPFVSQLLRWCFDCGATMLGRTHISADNHFNLGTIFDLGCCCWCQTLSIKVLQRGLGYSAIGSSMW